MFEDFGRERGAGEGRGRRGASALLSVGIFGGIALLVGGAMTTHHIRAKQRQQDAEITFAALPQMKAPKPKLVTAPELAKKEAAPKKMSRLTEIPDERPAEAEGDLVEAEDTGAVDGVVAEAAPETRSSAASRPPPASEPPPERRGEQIREAITRPVFTNGCRAPDLPDALHAQAATIEIDVRMVIGTDGKVRSASVLRSHPLIPDDLILGCANAQLFEPAHLPDGTPVPYPFRRRFVFKPAQA